MVVGVALGLDDVLRGVEAKTKELNEQLLPKDVTIHPFYDRTELVDQTGWAQPALFAVEVLRTDGAT